MVLEKHTKTIPAGEFKAKCLALMDEVARTGEEIIITKRGKPVARLEAVEQPDWLSLRGSLLWQADDIVSPIASDEWDSLQC